MNLRKDAEQIYTAAIESALPERAVESALNKIELGDSITIIAVGKAACKMAAAAEKMLGGKIKQGLIVTKYGHSADYSGALNIIEAGHPVPDENSVKGADAAVGLVCGLTNQDTVLFLLSGGGSALFEKPLIPFEMVQDITKQLLACSADIVEINTIRKRLSGVKGGRFSLLCSPARVVSIILSDVIGYKPDMIASGPTVQDTSCCESALTIAEKYSLKLTDEVKKLLHIETPRQLKNCEMHIIGSVRQLCERAKKECEALGYKSEILTDSLSCSARSAGEFLAAIARYHRVGSERRAYILGGETVVNVKGCGLGGRNQELALAAAQGIAGIDNAAIFSVGSDGTDGPTDAAGGYVDGATKEILLSKGIRISDVLENNDSYNALKECGGLIFTGPTGTNVNDLTVLLIGSK